MGAEYVSRDGHWTVTPIVLNGTGMIRVEHDTVWLPDGTIVPSHWTDKTRCGIMRTAHGFLVGDFRTVAEVERYVPLRDLDRVKGA